MAERRRSTRMQAVEVDEGPAADGGPGAGAARASSRVRRLVLVAAAVAALGLVVAWLLASAHDRSYVRRVQEVPGLVHPLGGPPHELWRAPGVADRASVEAAAGQVVVVARQGRSLTLTAHDGATGTTTWAQDVASVLAGDTEGPDVRCPSDGRDVGPLVICLTTPARSLYATGAGRSDPTATTVLALGARDGGVLGRWRVTDSVADSLRIGDDVVLVTYDTRGFLGVERRAGADGAVRWSYRSSDGLVSSQATPSTTVRLEAGRVVVQGAGTLLVDAASGRVLLDERALLNVVVVPVGDGAATWHVGAGWQVSGADGRARYALPGTPVVASVDDGTTDAVLLTDSGDALQAVDPASGTVLWATPQTMNVVARVSHRLVVAGDDRFGVLDPRTGALLWQVVPGLQLDWEPLSDGAFVLGPGESTSGAPQLVAYHLADGVRSWAIDLPAHVVGVDVAAGRVLVRTPSDVVLYG